MHPQNEDYWGHVNPIGPRACYDEGKRVAETMCYAYMKQVCLMVINAHERGQRILVGQGSGSEKEFNLVLFIW